MSWFTKIKKKLPFSIFKEQKNDTLSDVTASYREYVDYGNAHTTRPDRRYITTSTESSIVMPLFNKIATDIASLNFRHVITDDEGKYLKTINSPLNQALNLEANLDQSGRALMQDLIISLIDEGCVALVPVDTETDINENDLFDIYTLRVARIVQWHPYHIRVEVYNEATMLKEEVTLPKRNVCVIDNPLYHIMNEPNSILKRLIAKLHLLDAVDNKSAANKLDLIIQLPFITKTSARKAQAETRRTELEDQMENSKLGIGYIDGTERITQLNRPATNNLLDQIRYLTKMVQDQLGISEGVLSGNATEQEMINYYSRTIEPIVGEVVQEMTRKFLTRTARAKKHAVMYFRDPFKLVPISQIADVADKFTRNEILSSNDVRSMVGLSPSKDPKANELRNKNIPAAKQIPTDEANKIATPNQQKEEVDNEV